jgi:hypothetical protein
MPVAFVLDFPGARKQQYDEVVDRMQLGGRMAPGGRIHAAGSFEDGWRVIDVWQDAQQFERFRDEQIAPHAQAAGMQPPHVRALEVDDEMTGNDESTVFVQCVYLPGIDRDMFRAAHERIVPGGEPPAGLTWHVNGPVEGGWCVIDGWSSKELRDQFMESRVRPGFEGVPMSGPPEIQDLAVEATLAPAAATAA